MSGPGRVRAEVGLGAPDASWRALRVALEAALAAGGVAAAAAEARWLTEEASGHPGASWLEVADRRPPARARARLDEMGARRLGGAPLQYVLGSWSFRGLDLMVDERVLIPRPETEQVVEVALAEAARLGLRRGGRRRGAVPLVPVADLGTGSGAVALALAAELPDVEVWATDRSADALAVARANAAGQAATRVRLARGSWFDALPAELRGRLALVVSNPPYVSEAEVAGLPATVAAYEPRQALVSGPTGLEDLEAIVAGARTWLAPGAALVCEITPARSDAARALASDAGLVEVGVQPDLAGRDRALVARAPDAA